MLLIPRAIDCLSCNAHRGVVEYAYAICGRDGLQDQEPRNPIITSYNQSH